MRRSPPNGAVERRHRDAGPTPARIMDPISKWLHRNGHSSAGRSMVAICFSKRHLTGHSGPDLAGVTDFGIISNLD